MNVSPALENWSVTKHLTKKKKKVKEGCILTQIEDEESMMEGHEASVVRKQEEKNAGPQFFFLSFYSS